MTDQAKKMTAEDWTERLFDHGEPSYSAALAIFKKTLTLAAQEARAEVLKSAKFWSDIDVGGKDFDIEQAKIELVDYRFLLEQIPTVYDAVTGGLLSKPLYTAETVVDAFQDYLQRERDEAFEEGEISGAEAMRTKCEQIAIGMGDEGIADTIRALPVTEAGKETK